MENHDTYFALLEQIEIRETVPLDRSIRYETRKFDFSTYCISSGSQFSNRKLAYAHWLNNGRSRGFEWAPGIDSLLKIVLKAKDENALIDRWISHHAAIVGYENLIILDCGSENIQYIDKLNSYRDKVLILNYRKKYDYIHDIQSNRNFYDFLSKNCKYGMILDADEFLIGRKGNQFSRKFVKDLFKNSNSKMICGIWIDCTLVENQENISIEGDQEIILRTSPENIVSGFIAGKAAARSDVILKIGHLGHNLHSASVIPFIDNQSYGNLMIMHLEIPSELRRRAAAHLIGKNFVDLNSSISFEHQVKNLAFGQKVDAQAKYYAQRYMRGAIQLDQSSLFTERLFGILNTDKIYDCENLTSMLNHAELEGVLINRKLVLQHGDQT